MDMDTDRNVLESVSKMQVCRIFKELLLIQSILQVTFHGVTEIRVPWLDALTIDFNVFPCVIERIFKYRALTY